jgi:beta-glucosidase
MCGTHRSQIKYSFHWRAWVVGCILAVGSLNLTCAAQTRPSTDVEQRVDRLVSQLTLTEKLGILGGTNNMFTIGVPRLGIPALKMADGPLGTRTDGSSTAFPAGAALAATWDVQLADQEGICLGRDARSRGDHILLGPAMNIYREPQNGRNFEYLGEDPFLAGQIAAAYVRGVQSQSVAACVKHFVCNNQETQRDTIDAIVDERTLREIYLPAFEAAIKQGQARAVMAAYNQVNGSHMSASGFLLNDVLKNQWKFDGVVMSDWGATHDTLAAANGGLDLEMPTGQYFNAAAIWPLMQSGKITPATIDDKIRRLLRLMIQMGWMDRPQTDPGIARDDAQSNQTRGEYLCAWRGEFAGEAGAFYDDDGGAVANGAGGCEYHAG